MSEPYVPTGSHLVEAWAYWKCGPWNAERFETARAEARRGIAKIKADAVREAASTLAVQAGLLKPMHGEHPAVRELLERADRIEGKDND